MNLRETIADAEARHVAIGHFNVATLDMFWGVIGAARELNVPVIIGVTEGERDFIGLKQSVVLVESVRAEGLSVFLNGDHTYSVERVKEAIDAGFDAVIFDGAKLPFDENIAKTKECVEYAHASGREVLLEGEFGFIGSGSTILEEIPEGAAITPEMMTQPKDATRFVTETGIDLFAPAVGNIHGMLKNVKNPNLNIPRVREIREAAGTPLVLHGGSGISNDDFRAAIQAGISTVHISTEIRIAYRKAFEKTLAEHDDLAPYKYLPPTRAAVHDVVLEKLKLFSGL